MTPLALDSSQVEERLGPLQRLEALCDHGSIQPVRGAVRSRRMGDRASAGDGVVGATGTVDGRPLACFAQDPSYLGGSLGEVHADTICAVLEHAGRARIPVVGFIESAGARLQEGVAALGGYARIFRAHTALSGQVPQISVICGASAGGGSYAPALTDIVVMTKRASMFLTGPGVVQEVTGEQVDGAKLGGIIRHGAKLVHAFAAASVPRLTLVMRKAYGGAFIAMNGRDLGADLALAWPSAQIGVMGATQAVNLVNRRDIAAADDPELARTELADRYAAEHLTAESAAAEGVIDEIVEPVATRARLAGALRTLANPERPARPARNIPL